MDHKENTDFVNKYNTELTMQGKTFIVNWVFSIMLHFAVH